MAQEVRSPSLIVRFLDSFLQERNIKWVLAVGMTIVFGSSLLLVSTYGQQCPPLWQNLIALGYVVAIHASGQWMYHRLGLRRTGTVLQGLTVLLIPVLFLVIRWLPGKSEERPPGYVLGLLFAATTAFSVPAARRIFRHFLRSTQPTFLVSYLVLAMAGALLPLTPQGYGPLAVGALWAAFAIGSVKVARHVFWLTEENRKPRIFGFFPIALLGAQFLSLYGIHPELHVDVDWLGFGLVLVAAPVLATADAVARVFQQRTGGLVRPLPWSIMLPLLAGIMLCATGTVLAGTGLFIDKHVPAALFVTALAAAGLMLPVARRTRKEAFVWAMLIGVTIAYYTTPRLCSEFVEMLKAQGARAVDEQKLPVAFYGLTFFPLLLTLLVAGKLATRAGSELFARPMRLFSLGLTTLFWVLSLTHEKALFPAGLVLVILTATQLRVLRFWPALLIAIPAWFTAALGLPVFAEHVLHIPRMANIHVGVACLTAAAAGLLAVGLRVDGWLARLLPGALAAIVPTPCRSASLVVTLVLALAGAWFAPHAVLDDFPMGALLAGLLVAHAAIAADWRLAATAILFAQAVAARALVVDLYPWQVVSVGTMALLGEWLVGELIARFARGPVGAMFVRIHQRICSIELAGLAAVVYLPVFAVDQAVGPPPLYYTHNFHWMSRVAITIWTLDLLRRQRSVAVTVLAQLCVLGIVGSGWVALVPNREAWTWLPAVWAGTGLAMLAAAEAAARQIGDDIRIRTAKMLAGALFLGITFGSLVMLDWTMHAAGLLAFAGLAWIAYRADWRTYRLPLAMLLNLQAFGIVATVVMPGAALPFVVNAFPLFALPFAAAGAVSLFLWELVPGLTNRSEAEGVLVWRGLLRGLVFGSLVSTLGDTGLYGIEVPLAITAFLLTAAAELIAGCRDRSEVRIWIAEAVAALGFVYLVHFGVVRFDHEFAMFAVLGVGIALNVLKETLARRPGFEVLARPLGMTSLTMPLVAVGVGVARHLLPGHVDWLGSNSLAILLAAAFYFWRGIEEHRKEYHVLAAVILNIAIILLWRDLAWNDVQLIMIPIGISIMALVELLKREIPERFLNPLRYLGALVILVSPVFNMFGTERSWIPYFTLMVASVVIVLLAIGLRVRALLYAGTAFLVADLAAILVRGTFDNTNLLWIAGLGLGAGIVALGAYCEKHREDLVDRMNLLAASLKTWE